MMKEMNQVLVVIEDEYNTAENEFCPGVVTAEEGEEMPSPGEKVVVGVAMFVLPRSSERIGQFQNTSMSWLLSLSLSDENVLIQL